MGISTSEKQATYSHCHEIFCYLWDVVPWALQSSSSLTSVLIADVQSERAEALKKMMADSKALRIVVGIIVAIQSFLRRATPQEFQVGFVADWDQDKCTFSGFSVCPRAV